MLIWKSISTKECRILIPLIWDRTVYDLKSASRHLFLKNSKKKGKNNKYADKMSPTVHKGVWNCYKLGYFHKSNPTWISKVLQRSLQTVTPKWFRHVEDNSLLLHFFSKHFVKTYLVEAQSVGLAIAAHTCLTRWKIVHKSTLKSCQYKGSK